MKSEVWPIKDLKNWDKNPRSIDKKDFPLYCQVIVDRWEQFTSKKAKKNV